MPRTIRIISFLLCFIILLSSFGAIAQSQTTNSKTIETEKSAPQQVTVNPTATDKDIKKRLENILQATDWFEKINIKVENGIVFLNAETKTEKHQQWAETIAYKTENVVAVINNIKIVSSASWLMTQFKTNVNKLWDSLLHLLPYLGLSLLILIFAWYLARLIVFYSKKSLLARGLHVLLADILSRGFAILGFLVGLYVVLQMLGLSTMALSILGGTGVIGIILGIAFRDITENLLASVLLSVQSPFQKEDLIEIENIIGYVQALTIRTTILLTREGHEVQIPNSTVYKSNIYNYTSTPNWREDFIVGIGYEDSVSKAQDIALNVLRNHSAVLKDPEPWILVEELGLYSVNIRVFFWFDGHKYHWRKVKSSVIRLTKRAFQDAGISMPGQVIELQVTDEVSIKVIESKTKSKNKKTEKESSSVSTDAEGGLGSDQKEVKEQGRKIRNVNHENNLLQQSPEDDSKPD